MPDLKFEQSLLQQGYEWVIGIDEAGRGAWAGPVSVGYYGVKLGVTEIPGVNDSKQVSAKRRATFHTELSTHEVCGVKYAEPLDIDSKGIAVAIEDLISEIITTHISPPNLELEPPKVFFLIDGRFSRKFGQHSKQVIRGDAVHYSIAAASILAKVGRDNLMYDLDLMYPDYKFRSHVGYGTRNHIAAIRTFGLSPIHRRSYDIHKYVL